MRKIAILGLAAVAALAIACGTGSQTGSSVSGGKGQTVDSAPPTRSTTTAKVGQTVTLTNDLAGDKTTVNVTVASPKQYSKEPGDFGSTPEHGLYLVLDVTVVCKQGTYSANPFNFKFVAKDGTVSEGAMTVSFTPALNATDLSAGQKVAGKIAYDIPKTALSGGRVQIDGIGLDYDQPAAFWAL